MRAAALIKFNCLSIQNRQLHIATIIAGVQDFSIIFYVANINQSPVCFFTAIKKIIYMNA